MPINPNIALGVQPIQQPNMLAQYGQMMALKAAQQETEGYEGVKSAISGGMDPTDPRMLQYGPRGVAAFKAAGEGRSKQLEAAEKSLTLTGQIAGFVRDNPTPENFISAVGTMQQNGVLTPQQAQRVIADAGNDPAKIKTYAERAASDAIKEADKLAARTRIQAANIGAGPGYQQAALAREKYNDQLKYGGDLVTTTIPNPENPKERIEIQARRDLRTGQLIPLEVAPMPMRVDISPSSATSAFQPSGGGGGGTPNVLATQVAPQGPTFAQPKPTIRQPVAVMKDNKAVLVPPEQAVGLQPATAFAEKTAENKAQTIQNINTAISNLTDVTKPGGLLEKSTGSGIGKLRDVAYGFVGEATEGAIAAAKLAPVADLVLKMVPRFEGPQSDKDTQSYKEAAGQLADASMPNKVRAGAAKVILDLMKARRDQFEMSDRAGGGGGGVIDFGSLK